MDTSSFRTALPSVTDVYTDLNGLQNLKNEENNDEALKKVSQQFESMFISMLMKNMRAANDVFSEGNMFDTQEVKFYRDMHDNQLSLTLAHSGGFGIAEAMYRQMTEDKSGSKLQQNSEGGKYDVSNIPVTRAEMPVDRSLLNTQKRGVLSSEPNSDSINTSNNVDVREKGQQSENRHQLANSPQDFVEKVLPSAKLAAEKLDIDAEILVAQSALETGWGAKVFAGEDGTPTFNLFNIKAGSQWDGDAVYKNSLEFLGGQFTNVASKFRSYASIEESFQDFSDFILNSDRYQGAVDTASSGIDFIKKIHSAGYATDPNYSEKVNSVYQRVKSMIAGGVSLSERSNEL